MHTERQMQEMILGIMIDRFDELVNEKAMTVYPNTDEGIREYNHVCREINLYRNDIDELAKELNIKVRK